MLNKLFDSVCVTSACEHRGRLIICCPPWIRIFSGIVQEAEFKMEAICIYRMDSNLVILTDTQIQLYDWNLKLERSYTIQRPQTIHNYRNLLVLEYESEYQILDSQLNEMRQKNRIISFAKNPYNQVTYVEYNGLLQQSCLSCESSSMLLEIGVEQVFLANSTHTIYIYQSQVLPQLTFVDLELQQEIRSIDFSGQLEQVFILDEYLLLQSDDIIFKYYNQNIHKFKKGRISCAISYGDHTFIGSMNENQQFFHQNTQVQHLYNLGQAIDIHPMGPICYIASQSKQYPISLFRKGINDKLISSIKCSRRVRAIFFISSTRLLIQFTDRSQSFALPSFEKIELVLEYKEQTLYINPEIQITKHKIISSIGTIKFDEHILEAKVTKNIIYIYTSEDLIYKYDRFANLLGKISCNQLSCMETFNESLIFAKWGCFEHDYNLWIWETDKIPYSILLNYQVVSISIMNDLIILGTNCGKLLVIEKYCLVKIIEIGVNPIRLLSYSNKIIIQSQQIYLLNMDLSTTIINWDQVKIMAVKNDLVVGVVNDELQLVSLCRESSSQCHELKYIQNKEIIGVRFYQGKLFCLMEHSIECYQSGIFRDKIKLTFRAIKLELFDKLYIIGNDTKKGRLLILDSTLKIVEDYAFDFIYDLKQDQQMVYVSTEDSIQGVNNSFKYNFGLPIQGFDVRDNYFLIYEPIKGVHLYYWDERMIALGSLLQPCLYAQFHYEGIIAYSNNQVYIAKQSANASISDQLEIIETAPLKVITVSGSHYCTLWGQLGFAD